VGGQWEQPTIREGIDDVIALEFIGLLAILTASAALLSYGAEELAERYGANFTGSIVLAVITTMPEYMFVIWACLKGRHDMAVGSAVGACTLLITLGYGSVILLATTRMSRRPVKVVELSKATQVDALYLLVTALVAFVLAWEGNGFDGKDAAILIFLFLAYVVHVAKGAVTYARENSGASHARTGLLKSMGFLLAGGAAIFFFSGPFVDSMIEVAETLKISPVTVAIILGPLASEMPEKITAYITVIRNGKLAEISVCNFIGSKVNHNSLLLGTIPIIALLQGKAGVSGIISLPFIIMTALTVVATVSLSRRRLERWEGVMFMLLYVSVIWGAFHLGTGVLPAGHG
jgi:cation:H+ antiporter